MLYKLLINRNMRCIETNENRERDAETHWINRNMRCIETFQPANDIKSLSGLIET